MSKLKSLTKPQSRLKITYSLIYDYYSVPARQSAYLEAIAGYRKSCDTVGGFATRATLKIKPARKSR